MKKNLWIKWFLTITVSIVMLVCFSSISTAGKNVLDRKSIGVIRMFEINDLTGPTSETCSPFHDAFVDGLADLKKQGGLIYNDPKTGQKERVKIKYNFGDNKAKSGLVPMLYERFSNQNPKPVISWCGSSAACEIMPAWAQRDQIPVVAAPSGQPIWSPPRWSFVITPDYPAQAAGAAIWAMEDWKKKGKKGKPKWAWLTLDIPYGRAMIAPESTNFIEKLGFEIVGTWTIPYMPVDTTTELRAIKKAGANYFYGNTGVLQEAQIMKDLQKLGLKESMQRVSNPYTPTLKMIKNAGTAADGLVGIHYLAMVSETHIPGVKMAADRARAHKRAFDSDYMVGCYYYEVCTQAVKRALEKKGFPITGADVYQSMIDPAGFDLHGMTTLRPFTKNEVRGSWDVYMRKIENGKIVRVSKTFKIPDMKPDGPWTPKK